MCLVLFCQVLATRQQCRQDDSKQATDFESPFSFQLIQFFFRPHLIVLDSIVATRIGESRVEKCEDERQDFGRLHLEIMPAPSLDCESSLLRK
jgi:hypothetical protein